MTPFPGSDPPRNRAVSESDALRRVKRSLMGFCLAALACGALLSVGLPSTSFWHVFLSLVVLAFLWRTYYRRFMMGRPRILSYLAFFAMMCSMMAGNALMPKVQQWWGHLKVTPYFRDFSRRDQAGLYGIQWFRVDGDKVLNAIRIGGDRPIEDLQLWVRESRARLDVHEKDDLSNLATLWQALRQAEIPESTRQTLASEWLYCMEKTEQRWGLLRERLQHADDMLAVLADTPDWEVKEGQLTFTSAANERRFAGHREKFDAVVQRIRESASTRSGGGEEDLAARVKVYRRSPWCHI